jgi:hypothetical protein
MRLTLTVPGNPNVQSAQIETPKNVQNVKRDDPFKKQRGGSFRSSRSSGQDSRNSLDSAGFGSSQEIVTLLSNYLINRNDYLISKIEYV